MSKRARILGFSGLVTVVGGYSSTVDFYHNRPIILDVLLAALSAFVFATTVWKQS